MNVNRRDFLKIGMLTGVAATFTACGRPVEHGLVSQYQMPEYALPGQPLYWASTCTELRADCAVSVKTVENRAINVMGMPGHFFTKGYANKEAISGLQAVYSPDRVKASKGGKPGADGKLSETLAVTAAKAAGSDTLFVVDRICGSTGHALVQSAVKLGAKIWVADKSQSVRERRILKAVTGRAELPLYALEKYDYVLSVGSNFIHENYAPTRVEWSFGRFRKTPGRLRGRMLAVSSRMNPTDANADVWLALAPGTEATFLAAVGTEVSKKGKSGWPSWANVEAKEAAEKTGISEENIQKLAERLIEADSPMVVGGFQGADGDATVFLAHTLTKMLRGDVETFEPDMLVGSGSAPAGLFLTDAEAATALGSAKTVIVHGVDLVYRFPWLAEAFKKVRNRVVLAATPNDTTEEATILVPLRCWLEDWGDLRVKSAEGEWYGITQPAIRSQVSEAQSLLGFLLEFARQAGVSGVDEVNPRKVLQGERSQQDWEDMLARGGVWKEIAEDIYPHRAAYPPAPLANKGNAPAGYSAFSALEPLAVSKFAPALPAGDVFIALPTHLADGELASRPWMQELPDAMTTVVWDSWIEVNAEWAKENNIARHDKVEISTPKGKFEGSAYPSPWIHRNAFGVPTGRGQKRGVLPDFVSIGWQSSGSNPKALLEGTAGESGYFEEIATGVKVTKLGGSKLLATFDQRVYNLPRHILP